MKRIVMIAIAFFTVMSFSQTQLQKPSELVAQQKSSGSNFQQVKLFTTVNDQKSNAQLPKELKEFTLFSFDQSAMKSFKSKRPETMNLPIPGQKSSMSLDLVKVDIATDDFQAIEMPSGKVLQTNSDIVHYRGIVKGKPNSIAAVSFFGDQMSGIISVGEEAGNIVMGKMDNNKSHILYKDNAISHLNDFACRMEGQVKSYTKEELFGGDTNNKAAAKCPRIFFDVGNDIVNDKGGSQGATNFIQAVFNQVAVLYANENISIKLSGMKVWTSSTPFSNLDNFRSYRNQNSFNGDLGHFVTYNYSGGVAWLSALCGSRKYGLSGINKNYSNVPTYSWTVGVIAHELGHNFGSNHTHACVWNGNNTAIDGCYTTEGGCAKPAIPSGGGTIMSYCHLTGAGINFNKGFGSQPANVMRNFINRASCVQSCDGGGCNTGDQVSVTFRNNTDCTLEYYENNTRKGSANAGGTYRANTRVGNSWQAKKSSGATVDNFSIVCNQTTYSSSGSCGGGTGGNCDGVSPWSAGTTYSVGDRVTYRGNLFEKTATGWKNLGACTTSNDPCDGVRPWSAGTTYSVGDRVTYQGSLFEKTATGWRNLGRCGSTRNTIVSMPPLDGEITANEFRLLAYPNPANEFINLEISNLGTNSSHIKIKDMNGRALKSIELSTPPSGVMTQRIDVSKLSTGMYFIQVTNTKKTITKKVFIQ
ncbi:M12 family metallo-peptidase [Aquimarina hainanensis]|uniref:M12 family metallo-peptidase n=1 Tax=Aquimarina hainanensis TaxID=1578017 RepID=A0ABW5NF38_9FLAO